MWLNSKCNTKFNESRVSRKRVYLVDKYDFFVRSLTLISEKGYVGCLVLRCWGATKNEWISKSAGGSKLSLSSSTIVELSLENGIIGQVFFSERAEDKVYEFLG